MAPERARWNAARFDPDSPSGFYESWFLRANHPEEPRAFWLRYTFFQPRRRPDDAVGELWAVAFERGVPPRAAKSVLPIAHCALSRSGLDIALGEARLEDEACSGEAAWDGAEIGWKLAYTSPVEPLLLFPERLYAGRFPRAKALVPSPAAVFSGVLDVDGKRWEIDGWPGSQNHNWGLQHTDDYAWGQVAGFDDEPGSFLECGVGRVRLGPVWSPTFSPLVLRQGGEVHRLNSLWRCLRNRGETDFYRLDLEARRPGLRVFARFDAVARDFVALPYADPPGGVRTCLNSKLARCTLRVERRGRPARTLHSAHRAALEILPTRDDHGIPLLDLPTPR